LAGSQKSCGAVSSAFDVFGHHRLPMMKPGAMMLCAPFGITALVDSKRLQCTIRAEGSQNSSSIPRK
jgi:hypothetical protein